MRETPGIRIHLAIIMETWAGIRPISRAMNAMLVDVAIDPELTGYCMRRRRSPTQRRTGAPIGRQLVPRSDSAAAQPPVEAFTLQHAPVASEPTGPDTKPIEVVDVAQIPGGGQLHLLKCGDDFSIQFGTDELMGSRNHRSEQALATLTCERLARNDGHVLVGGLGMGFTLGAVLAAWAPTSSVVVAELVPRVAEWAKGPLAHLSGTHLDDERVSLKLADVHDVIVNERDHFDAILLDVDNGPDGFIQPENDRLYCNWGLRAAYAALRPKGVLAVWSAYPDPSFVDRLETAGFEVEETQIPAFAGSQDDWHSIWFASRPD